MGKKLLALFLALTLLLPMEAYAYEKGQSYHADLSPWIENENRREYMEMMIDYHVRSNSMVKDALDGGFSALFLFDGCSDNMDDPALQDLSYYRVTGVCVVLGLDGFGNIQIRYVSENCSTIPDRPLEIGAWAFPEVGDVGPATVCDGTYQMYSVRHKGAYEAIHLRTEYTDASLEAVYMLPEGFVVQRATEINIHTRTSNHVSGRGMWSAGCPLVGAGESWEFWKLIENTYYQCYDAFEVDNFLGCVTIDRMTMSRELYALYGSTAAVDRILLSSREIQPEQYLKTCPAQETLEEPESMKAAAKTSLMTLPCDNTTDARSRSLCSIPEGKRLRILGRVENTQGQSWYEAEFDGQYGYLKAESVTGLGLLDKLLDFLF